MLNVSFLLDDALKPATPLTNGAIGGTVYGTPSNFNGFLVLASLLQRRRSTEDNQTLHNVWPLPGLIDYIYIFGVTKTEFCHVQN